MYFRKRFKTGILSIFVSGLLSLFPLIAPTARAEDTQPSGVSEDASAALARMSTTLHANEFSFRSRTFRAYAGPNGELLHIAHATKTVFRRPDRLSARAERLSANPVALCRVRQRRVTHVAGENSTRS